MNKRVVVITGASAGVGRATVREFARHGWAVGLIARGEQRLREAEREARRLGGDALAVRADVADPHAVEDAAARIERAFGPITVWINNAMTSVFAPVVEITPVEYRRVTEVTYLGYVHGTLAALRRMRVRNAGTIVQVGSALAYRSIPLQSAYCAAKHAIVGFTDSLRCELLREKSKIHLTAVHLPALNTPQFGWVRSRLPKKAQPVPPIYQPEVAARAIYWAAHHRRRELNVGSRVSLAIWSQKFVPGLVDRYLARNGWESQQTGEPEALNRPSNLFVPVEADVSAHGVFDDQALEHSPHAWFNRHWPAVAAGAAGALAAGTALRRARAA